MNMTRAILERVQEVELQITPEFQKREDDVSAEVLNKAFAANGWQLVKASSGGQKGTATNTYNHQSIPAATMQFTFNTGTGYVMGQMMVDSGTGLDALRFDPDPDMVKKLTKDWLKIEAEETAKDKLPEIETVINMLVGLNWITTSDTVVFAGAGWKARVFQHPKVNRKIRVVYEPKTGNIVGAVVLNVDESILESIYAAPGSIYNKAQLLMKEAGV